MKIHTAKEKATQGSSSDLQDSRNRGGYNDRYKKNNSDSKAYNKENIFSSRKKELDPYLLVEKFDKLLKKGQWEEAIDLPNKYTNTSQSTVLWNKIIKSYSYSGDKNRAMKAFNDMKKRSFLPNHQTFTALLVAFSRSTSPLAVSEAKELYDKIPRYLESHSIVHINTMLLVYATNNLTLAMEGLYQQMPKTGPTAPDLITYTTILKYHKRRLEDSVNSMIKKPYPKNESTYPKAHSKPHFDPKDFYVKDTRSQKINSSNNHHEKSSKILDNELLLESQAEANEAAKNLQTKPQDIMITMLNVWDDFREDLYCRYKEHSKSSNNYLQENETPLLSFDSIIVNCLLEAGNKLSLIRNTHKLTRSVIKAVESIYVPVHNTNPITSLPNFNPFASKSDKKSIVDSIPSPLTSIVLSKFEKNNTQLEFFNNSNLSLFLKLCKHNHEFMRADRIWEYAIDLQNNSDFRINLYNYSLYFYCIHAKLSSI
ncbi:Pentatricopeptide repeat-containing protein [Smittium culicis]|uniref:Pentatricopeptide repeat-containing protein n=1 Tax=Smittium culicis TaxID=133412 RepID=A0A1R1YSL7_9FUNG|nr:Pentatricopeptide repeat-containing protein [Smittium culicis]OMJ29845.1 Pentatricopeptide repeat-containing protein [Smittium culicis]